MLTSLHLPNRLWVLRTARKEGFPTVIDWLNKHIATLRNVEFVRIYDAGRVTIHYREVKAK